MTRVGVPEGEDGSIPSPQKRGASIEIIENQTNHIMKKTVIIATLSIAALGVAFAGFIPRKCTNCNGTGWKGSSKCLSCGGDGDSAN